MVRILLLRPKFYKSIRFHINFRSAYFPCPNRQVQIKYTCCTDEEGNHWKEKTRGMGRTTFPTATVIMVESVCRACEVPRNCGCVVRTVFKTEVVGAGIYSSVIF